MAREIPRRPAVGGAESGADRIMPKIDCRLLYLDHLVGRGEDLYDLAREREPGGHCREVRARRVRQRTGCDLVAEGQELHVLADARAPRTV